MMPPVSPVSAVSQQLDEIVVGDRFVPRKVLKAGPAVETLLAFDRVTAREVVIKTAPLVRLASSILLRLEHEMGLLREAAAAHAALPLHIGRSLDRVITVTPYVPGRTLQEILAERRPKLVEVLTVGRDVLGALRDMHERGVVHREVCPDHVVASESHQEIERAVLIGFGLSRNELLEPRDDGELVRLALYASPEGAGMVGSEVDERSDLYSTGLLLFECLTGARLVDADNLQEALRRHLIAALPQSFGPSVPRALHELVCRLVQKDPRQRYQCARSALADLDDIAAALARGEAEPAIVIGRHDPSGVLKEPPLVGRASELQRLEAGLERARRGEGGIVLLEADSGGGKSRLLDEFAARATSHAWVLRGAAGAQGRRPLDVLRGVAAAVDERAMRESAFAERLRAELGSSLDELGAVFPALLPNLGIAAYPPPLVPEAVGEERLQRILAQLLDSLGEPGRPAVVLLDDCQWADDVSLRLLGTWLRRAEGQRRLLVVAAFRSEDVEATHLLRTLPGTEQIELRPLSAQEIQLLVESAAGPLPPDALDTIAHASDGNPFMVVAVLHGLVESGALTWDGVGWRTDPMRLSELRSSRRAAAFLLRRMELLPARALRVLSLGAIQGKQFTLEHVLALSGETLSDAMAMLEEARRRHMLWVRARGTGYEFVHEKLREAVLARLDAEERQSMHRLAAERLEAIAPSNVFELAYHYDAAGEPARALPYALESARRARAQYALEIAERQYRIAEHSGAGAPRAIRRAIAEGLGDIHMLRGRSELAEEEFGGARSLADDVISQATLDGKLGEVAIKRGDMAGAARALERGLSLLGHPVPSGDFALRNSLVREVAIQTAHTAFPRLLLHRRPLDAATADLLAVRLYNRLGFVYWFNRGSRPCLWANLRELNLAERYPPTAELAQAWSVHSPILTTLPLFGRSRRYAERSLELRKRLNDPWGQGQSHCWYAVALYGASRYRDSLEHGHRAVELLDRTGDRWQAMAAKRHIALCHYRLGELRKAVEESQDLHRAALEIGSAQGTAHAVATWTKAARGRVPAELLQVELARPSADAHRQVELLSAEGIRLLAAGDAMAARSCFERADELADSHGLRQEYVVSVKPWLATALRLELAATPGFAADRRRDLLARCRRATRAALAAARFYRNNLPHALREAGFLAATLGQARRARRLLDRSLAVAVRQEARYEHALTLEARGEIGRLLGWPEAGTDLAEARRVLQSLDRSLLVVTAAVDERPTLSLAARFSTVVSAGRRIASALTDAAVHRNACDAMLALLRADRCMVLRVHEDGRLEPIDDEDLPWSPELARRALRESAPVSMSESSAPGDGVLPEGVRSALCVPVCRRGRAVSLLYADHRQIDGLFGEEESRLAAYIATLAGAALDNAAGFAEIEQAVRVRDEFLSVASHELRTPLTVLRIGIESLTKLLRQPPSEWSAERLIDLVTRIERAQRRQYALVERLLDVSRITSGRLELQWTDVDLSVLVTEAAARIRPECDRAGSTLTLDVAEGVTGRWDAMRLDSVVSNLLGNAVKYGCGRPIEMKLEADATTARLIVRDHGMGIAPSDLERIFERFERLVSARHYGGFGLGLWIVRQTVEALGGTVRVTSELRVGSTFTVELPRRAKE